MVGSLWFSFLVGSLFLSQAEFSAALLNPGSLLPLDVDYAGTHDREVVEAKRDRCGIAACSGWGELLHVSGSIHVLQTFRACGKWEFCIFVFSDTKLVERGVGLALTWGERFLLVSRWWVGVIIWCQSGYSSTHQDLVVCRPFSGP